MSIPGGGDNDTRPLYARVRERLVERIQSGVWKPGQLIPNEFEIAAEFGVSQGTARKAISALASEQLVTRRQGRGTFVVEHTPAHVLFRFFNLFDENKLPIVPSGDRMKTAVAQAKRAERTALDLAKDERVIRITRVRLRDGKPFISEFLVLPEALFPDLVDREDVPHTLYDLFQKAYGIHVMRTDDRISAVAADAKTADTLRVPVGAPLLKIDRIAYALDERPVEWRVSLCHLDGAHYLARAK